LKEAKIKTALYATVIFFITCAIIFFPDASLEASKRGLHMWWNIVFPSLLPFFIVSEILISIGVVRFIGVFLEPLMRPVFKVPGAGGFVWAMGMASGFPAGAKLTARLRQENQISRHEAERLVSFSNSSNPLFIFGAVSIGFFQDKNLGLLLAVSHYLGNVFVGLTMRFWGKDEKKPQKETVHSKPSFKKAFQLMHEMRMQNEKPLGKMLGDAVLNSVQTLLVIGGFIILFSVLNQILSIVHVADIAATFISSLFILVHIPTELSVPFFSGLFEITLGSQLTSQAQAAMLDKVIITSFILAFSGFSVQAQVASILAETDIRFKPFFFARIMQGIFSSLSALILFKPLYIDLLSKNEGYAPAFIFEKTPSFLTEYWLLLSKVGPVITICTLIVYILIYYFRLRNKSGT
jgi:sporulation integral membrane protein YlbJ